MHRRQWLHGLAATALTPWAAGCRPARRPLAGGWVGSDPARGHRLRSDNQSPAATGTPRRATVAIVGGGIAGLAAARALQQGGVDDYHLFELEDQAGGNSRAHRMRGLDCPLGAHYLPLPGPQAHEVAELLESLGVSRQHLGRTVYDERYLCHSPQERLFHGGRWHDGLLPLSDAPRDTRSHWSQGTVGWGSEETLPMDSQAGFPRPPEDRLPRSVVIAVWLAVAAVLAVLAMIVYRSFF